MVEWSRHEYMTPVTSEATCKNCGSHCNLCDKFDKNENERERDPCHGCGKRQMIFKGPNTDNNFCKWLISDQHKNVTAIAHNSRAYDAYFIYDYLMRIASFQNPLFLVGPRSCL